MNDLVNLQHKIAELELELREAKRSRDIYEQQYHPVLDRYFQLGFRPNGTVRLYINDEIWEGKPSPIMVGLRDACEKAYADMQLVKNESGAGKYRSCKPEPTYEPELKIPYEPPQFYGP